MDGWNSLIRYYKNNFSDGFRQVSWALNCGEKMFDKYCCAFQLLLYCSLRMLLISSLEIIQWMK